MTRSPWPPSSGGAAPDLAALPPAARALHDPEPVPVQISDQLKSLQDRTARDIIRRTASASTPDII